MQPIVYNNLMKYLLFRVQFVMKYLFLFFGGGVGIVILFSFLFYHVFSDSYTVNCMCDTLNTWQQITTKC